MAYVEKLLQCSDCGATFAFSVADQSSSPPKGMLTSPSAVLPAAKQGEQSAPGIAESGAKCSLQCALSVAKKHKYRFSLERAGRSIAVIATTRSD